MSTFELTAPHCDLAKNNEGQRYGPFLLIVTVNDTVELRKTRQ